MYYTSNLFAHLDFFSYLCIINNESIEKEDKKRNDLNKEKHLLTH